MGAGSEWLSPETLPVFLAPAEPVQSEIGTGSEWLSPETLPVLPTGERVERTALTSEHQIRS